MRKLTRLIPMIQQLGFPHRQKFSTPAQKQRLARFFPLPEHPDGAILGAEAWKRLAMTAQTKRNAYRWLIRPVSLLLCLNSLPILLLWANPNNDFPNQFCNLFWLDMLLLMMLRFFKRKNSAKQTKLVSVRMAVARSRLFSCRGLVRLVAALLLCCIVPCLLATIKSPAIVDG